MYFFSVYSLPHFQLIWLFGLYHGYVLPVGRLSVPYFDQFLYCLNAMLAMCHNCTLCCGRYDACILAVHQDRQRFPCVTFGWFSFYDPMHLTGVE